VNRELVDRVARALLYEGYMLYPYRASSIKNQHRWTFGVLYPGAWSADHSGNDSSHFETECLVRGGSGLQLDVSIRCLHLFLRDETEQPAGRAEAGHDVLQQAPGSQQAPAWQEAEERRFELPALDLGGPLHLSQRVDFAFPAHFPRQESVHGALHVDCRAAGPDLQKLTVRVFNRTECRPANRDEALLRSMISAHAVLAVRNGEFISLLDPPPELCGAAAACRNVGVWPVLAGETGARDAMLAAPIILYDYPQVAEESPGELFDSSEIDEILTLRILTLTEDEKQEMRQADARTREMLDRSEHLPPAHMMKLHGAIRGLRRVTEESK